MTQHLFCPAEPQANRTWGGTPPGQWDAGVFGFFEPQPAVPEFLQVEAVVNSAERPHAGGVHRLRRVYVSPYVERADPKDRGNRLDVHSADTFSGRGESDMKQILWAGETVHNDPEIADDLEYYNSPPDRWWATISSVWYGPYDFLPRITLFGGVSKVDFADYFHAYSTPLEPTTMTRVSEFGWGAQFPQTVHVQPWWP